MSRVKGKCLLRLIYANFFLFPVTVSPGRDKHRKLNEIEGNAQTDIFQKSARRNQVRSHL